MTDILEKKQIIETDAEQISLPGFVRLVKARKKLFYVVMPIVLVVAICIHKHYGHDKILYHTDILGTRSGEHFYIGWRTRFAGILVWNRLEQYAIL